MREAMPDAILAASFRIGGAANFTTPSAGNGSFKGRCAFPEKRGAAPQLAVYRSIERRVTMMQLIKRFVREEEGVTAIEYGLIAALIAVVIIGSVTLVGTKLDGVFTTVQTTL